MSYSKGQMAACPTIGSGHGAADQSSTARDHESALQQTHTAIRVPVATQRELRLAEEHITPQPAPPTERDGAQVLRLSNIETQSTDDRLVRTASLPSRLGVT